MPTIISWLLVDSRDGANMVAANSIPAHEQSADQNQRMLFSNRICLLFDKKKLPHSACVDFQWPTQQHSLRHLAAMHLKWTIQQGSHDSKIDAIAALRLVKLKLQHGPFFGTSTVPGAHNLMDTLHDSGRSHLLISCCTAAASLTFSTKMYVLTVVSVGLGLLCTTRLPSLQTMY